MEGACGQASVISNSSSRESFAGLSGACTAPFDWDHRHTIGLGHNIMSNNITATSGKNSLPQQAQGTAENAASTSQSSTPTLTSAMPSSFPSTLIVSKNPLPILPSAGITAPSAPANNTVPEFLYQLTKMLTGGHNEIIEWSNGRIEVHSPHKLESIVLQKYFRHSKFASFQRQLNYFGFRKLAGKGKMAPCSYVNEGASQDIGSLLLIKRKATIPAKDKTSRKQGAERVAPKAPQVPPSTTKGVAHQGQGAPSPAASVSYSNGGMMAEPSTNAPVSTSTQQAIAKAAVGRGIRHSLGYDVSASVATSAVRATELQVSTFSADAKPAFYIPAGVEDSLSQLASNYHNSLAETPLPGQTISHENQHQFHEPTRDQVADMAFNDPFPSLLSRNSSLIDLAMIPNLDGEDENGDIVPIVSGMGFVDFPQPEVDPSNASTYRVKLEQTQPPGT